MALNTNSSKFRKVDVDQYCEDHFLDDQADPSTGDRPASACVENETLTRLEGLRDEVNSLLSTGEHFQSLQLVLRDPPVKCKDQLLKDLACRLNRILCVIVVNVIIWNSWINRAADIHIARLFSLSPSCVFQVLMNFKGAEKIEEAVNGLDKDAIDVLMKYIYRGFEFPGSKNLSCGALLVWHEKVMAKGGLGSIIRVMTDRRRV